MRRGSSTVLSSRAGPRPRRARQWATRRAERLAGHLGVPVDAMATLRHVPVERLVEATQRLAVEAPADGGLPLALLPVVDGVLLERPPGEMIVDGAAAAGAGPRRHHPRRVRTVHHGRPR